MISSMTRSTGARSSVKTMPFGWACRTRPVARASCTMGSDRKSTRLNSSHGSSSYAVFCLKKKTERQPGNSVGRRHPRQESRKAVHNQIQACILADAHDFPCLDTVRGAQSRNGFGIEDKVE